MFSVRLRLRMVIAYAEIGGKLRAINCLKTLIAVWFLKFNFDLRAKTIWFGLLIRW